MLSTRSLSWGFVVEVTLTVSAQFLSSERCGRLYGRPKLQTGGIKVSEISEPVTREYVRRGTVDEVTSSWWAAGGCHPLCTLRLNFFAIKTLKLLNVKITYYFWKVLTYIFYHSQPMLKLTQFDRAYTQSQYIVFPLFDWNPVLRNFSMAPKVNI